MLYPASKELQCQIGIASDKATGDCFRIGCGRWTCRVCGPRKRAKFIERAKRIPKSYRALKFITVTAPAEPYCGYESCRGDCGTCVLAFNRAWRRLYQWLRRREPNSYHYMWSKKHGHLHKHLILNVDYVPQAELSDACRRFGLGQITDIRAVQSAAMAAVYLSKYLVKASAQRWARHVRRVQSSRGLREHFESGVNWFVEMTLRKWERVNPISYEIRDNAVGYKLETINRIFEDAYLEEDAAFREPNLFEQHQRTEAWPGT